MAEQVEKLQDLGGGKVLLTSTGMQSSAATQLGEHRPACTAGLHLPVLGLQGQDGGSMQNISKSTVRHTRNFPAPHIWISGSFQKYNLPPSMRHKTNQPFSSSRSILIPTLAPEHKLRHITTQPQSRSPQPSRADQTSCRTSPACPVPPFRSQEEGGWMLSQPQDHLQHLQASGKKAARVNM